MSAERLRKAAALMRESWGEAAEKAAELAADGRSVGTIAPTLMAVADWLDAEAKSLEFDTGLGMTYEEAMSGMGFPALAVADAYLGDQP